MPERATASARGLVGASPPLTGLQNAASAGFARPLSIETGAAGTLCFDELASHRRTAVGPVV